MTKPTHGLSPALIVLMSVATGLAVASNYYAQPLLDTIAHHFSLSASSAGFIVTAAQLGYAAGLLFLVPLGDMFERRTLIVSMTLLAAGGMLITASSQSLSIMILGTALTGLFSVVAQILVPLAATLATPATRGKVVGTIMSGLLLGILLARTVAGLLANLGGWRTVFWVASALMALMAVALWRGLPKLKSDTHLNYPQLLGSVFSLFIHDKLLRTRALLGCLTFANFSILWTSMAFLLAAPPFSYSEGMIGLFGLAGAAGALGARPAGAQISPTTPLMAVVPATDLWVDANFKETQLANMRIGQPVTIITDIYGDDVKYTGKVVGLDMGTGSAFSLLPAQNATGNWIKVVQRLPVRVELDARQLEQHPLRIGLSTLVTVDTANHDGQVLASQVRTTPVAESNAREINLAPVNKLIDDIVQANAG